jgi:hypothetical protein
MSDRIQTPIEWKRHGGTKKFIIKPLCEVTRDMATERGLTDGGSTLEGGPPPKIKAYSTDIRYMQQVLRQ